MRYFLFTMMLLVVITSSSSETQPFSYKEVALGMNKDEVVRLIQKHHGVIPDCFDAGEYSLPELKVIGVHICALKNNSPVTDKFTIAGVPAGLVRYRFYNNRLFELHIIFAHGVVNGQSISRKDEYETVVHAYTEKYGKPINITTETFEDNTMSLFIKNTKKLKTSREIQNWENNGHVMRVMERADKNLLSPATMSIEDTKVMQKVQNLYREKELQIKKSKSANSDI